MLNGLAASECLGKKLGVLLCSIPLPPCKDCDFSLLGTCPCERIAGYFCKKLLCWLAMRYWCKDPKSEGPLKTVIFWGSKYMRAIKDTKKFLHQFHIMSFLMCIWERICFRKKRQVTRRIYLKPWCSSKMYSIDICRCAFKSLQTENLE